MTVQVQVDWGDGIVESLPASGTVDAWTLIESDHSYLPGGYTITVTGPDGAADSVPVTIRSSTWLSGASGARPSRHLAGHPAGHRRDLDERPRLLPAGTS